MIDIDYEKILKIYTIKLLTIRQTDARPARLKSFVYSVGQLDLHVI